MQTESVTPAYNLRPSALDERIATLLQQGDHTCLRLAFDHYYKPLCLYATRFLLSYDDIEDIVQSAFISLWHNHKKKPFNGSVRSYLFGAVAKASLKRMEDEHRYFFTDLECVTESLIDDLTTDTDDSWELVHKKLCQAIEALPERSREVLQQIIFQSRSYKEVAQTMGISVNTVRNHYAYALSLLRKRLGTKLFLCLLLFS
mgnify:CR=1 FL=1